MKIESAVNETVTPMPLNEVSLSCLRCRAELSDYRPTRFTFLPYGISRAHAMVVCPKCGHVEFFSKDSPLLNQLEPIASDAGDGD